MSKRLALFGSLAALLVVVVGVPSSASAAEPVACAITPFNPVNGSFHGAGYGTPQVIVENVTVKAQDHGTFAVECESPDTDPFYASAEYWFEASGVGGYSQVSPTFMCGASSVGAGRIQAAAFAVPGPTGCAFKHFYPENDPAAFKTRRLHIHLTAPGVDMDVASVAWAPVSTDCPPICT